MGNVEFVTVKVQIGNQTRTVKMEKGTQFQNKGGIFTADKNGATVKMTNYQMKVFEAVANNTQEQGMGEVIVLSAEDIKSAQHCKCVREFACKNEITNYFCYRYKL